MTNTNDLRTISTDDGLTWEVQPIYEIERCHRSEVKPTPLGSSQGLHMPKTGLHLGLQAATKVTVNRIEYRVSVSLWRRLDNGFRLNEPHGRSWQIYRPDWRREDGGEPTKAGSEKAWEAIYELANTIAAANGPAHTTAMLTLKEAKDKAMAFCQRAVDQALTLAKCWGELFDSIQNLDHSAIGPLMPNKEKDK